MNRKLSKKIVIAILWLPALLQAAKGPATAPSTNPDQAGVTKFYGTISAIDTKAMTFTVDNQVYSIVPESHMTKAADDSAATLADAVVGEPARGSYVKSAEGKLNVTKVRFGKKAGGGKDSVNSYRFWSPDTVIEQIEQQIATFGVLCDGDDLAETHGALAAERESAADVGAGAVEPAAGDGKQSLLLPGAPVMEDGRARSGDPLRIEGGVFLKRAAKLLAVGRLEARVGLQPMCDRLCQRRFAQNDQPVLGRDALCE